MGILNRLQLWWNWLTTDPLGFALYLLYFAVSVLLTLILHEIAHGYVAYRCGDPTAKMLGRLSLDPRKHLDPIGTLCLVFLGFGWAKPVPINPRNFRNIVKDTMLVSFAGPATNFLLSIGFAVLLRLLIEFFPLGEWQGNTVWDFFFLMFQTGVVVNIGLGWLNLMPIPPLDGSKILWGVLPPKLGFQYMQLERYGFLVLILLLMTGALGYVLYPLIQFSVNTVFSLIVLS